MIRSYSIITGLALLVAFSASFSAGVPTAINYQGRLTDVTGVPVADGGHLVQFIIYDSAVGGDMLWNSGIQNITTTDGLFNYALGSSNPLPDDIFTDTSRYIGITVDGNPEMIPHIRIQTNPFTYQALRADSANNSDMLDGMNSTDFVATAGDVMTGSLGFNNGSTPMTYIYQSGTNNPARAIVAHSPSYPDWGLMYDDLNDEFVFTGNGDTNMVVKPNGSGDNAVRLGENAIGSPEIVDEPGIAQDRFAGTIQLTWTSMTDIAVLTITIPVAGYIYLQGHTLFQLTWTRGSWGYLQIDETAGGDVILGHYTAITCRNDAATNIYECNTQRIYYKNAGTYTFHLEAKRSPGDSIVEAKWPVLTAIFLPTSYGSVLTVSSSPDDDPNAKAVQISDIQGNGDTKTLYQVDLRTLEIKARKAHEEALRAELEFQRAQNQQAKDY